MKNKMSITQYLKRKNDLIYEQTGIILTPDDQIVEVEKRILGISSDMDACPYCVAFYVSGALEEDKCTGCPMQEAGNGCLTTDDSTYEKITSKLSLEGNSASLTKGIEGLHELIIEFNKSNGFI